MRTCCRRHGSSGRRLPGTAARHLSRPTRAALLAIVVCWAAAPSRALRNAAGEETTTWSIADARALLEGEVPLDLTILDAATGEPVPARFTVEVDGKPYVPPALAGGGVHLTAIHQKRGQRFTVTYAAGRGAVVVPLPAGARRGRVEVAKGFEYLPAAREFVIGADGAAVSVELGRWADTRADGWVTADDHLHFDRADSAHDAEWLTAMAADDLTIGHFLLAKDTNVLGLWGEQYAYGEAGEAGDGAHLVRPGEEYRDRSQGHISLLGVDDVIWPVSTGGFKGSLVYNYPPLHKVLLRAHRLGGIGGITHGGAYVRRTTAALDTILGAADFFEIANTNLYAPDLWYQLMSCGWLLPPAAGTDLPNFPARDAWQPFLGEARMYVQTGGRLDFDSWKSAFRRGAVWVTSGPLLRFSVDGKGPGGTIHLPASGGTVRVTATLSSPRPLTALELVSSGHVVARSIDETTVGPIHRLGISHAVHFGRSGWIAARGTGLMKRALAAEGGEHLPTEAHSGAVEVLVGERPVFSPAVGAALAHRLRADRAYYARRGRFRGRRDRARFLAGFDRGLEILAERAAAAAPRFFGPRSGSLALAGAVLLLAGVAAAWRLRRGRQAKDRSVS